jgi:spore coat protein H
MGVRWVGAVGLLWMGLGCAQRTEPAGETPAFTQSPPDAPQSTSIPGHEAPGAPPLELTPPPPRSFPPVQTQMPSFELEIDPQDLAQLDANPRSDEKVPARIVLDGKSAPGRLRYRGSSTRTLPQKGYKIELDKGHSLDGRDHFELLAGYLDSGKLTEKFATDIYRALGVPISRTQYVRVSVNGEHQGLYLDMERVGKDFLRAHGFDDAASIYRAGGRNGELKLPRAAPYQKDYDKKTNEDQPYDDLDELLRLINRTDDAEFEQKIAERLDLDAYLAQLAGEALISNYLVEDEGGYWIHEPTSERWSYAPWDLNNCTMTFYRNRSPHSAPKTDRWPLVFSVYDPSVESIYQRRADDPEQRPTWSVLNTRLWDRPQFRARIIEELERGLDDLFIEEAAESHIDALWSVVESELAEDPYVIQEMADAAPAYLKRYVSKRRAYLLSVMDELRQHGGGDLVINEISFGKNGYVELHNRGTRTIDVGGMTLTKDLRQPLIHRLPKGLKIPAGGYLTLGGGGSDTELPFTLPTDGGELGLFDGVHVYGPADIVYFGPHPEGTTYSRTSDGSEDWRVGPSTPGARNEGATQ